MSDPHQLIYADPPWRFEVRSRETGLEKAADRHYDTLTVGEMIGMAPATAKNALMVMWVYDPMLPEALQLASAWGFSFVTVAFRWFKVRPSQLHLFEDADKACFGLGYHTRGGACEEAWLFKRGKGLKPLRHDIRKEFIAPRRQHSRKPDEVAQWLVDLYGDVPRLEMFARTRRPGWDAMGLETNKFTGEAA